MTTQSAQDSNECRWHELDIPTFKTRLMNSMQEVRTSPFSRSGIKRVLKMDYGNEISI